GSAVIARARKVLPLPRSPTRCTTASGASACAISRPAAIVSSSVRQSQRGVMAVSLITSHCTGVNLFAADFPPLECARLRCLERFVLRLLIGREHRFEFWLQRSFCALI